MGVDISARHTENQYRNGLACQTDLTCVGTAAPADRLLIADAIFFRYLFRILDKQRIRNIALVHETDLNASSHPSLGLCSAEIKIIRRRSLKYNSQIWFYYLGRYGSSTHTNLFLGCERANHVNSQTFPILIQLVHGINDTCTAGPVIKCFSKTEIMFLIIGKRHIRNHRIANGYAKHIRYFFPADCPDVHTEGLNA